MPTYALLGATGSTGSAILRGLISNPPKDLTINIFVRSRGKLLKLFPEIETTKGLKTNIIEGSPSDPVATQQCLTDVDVILACIGSNNCTPDMTLIYDTAQSIIDALKTNRTKRGLAYKIPTIIQLRSASVNPILKARMPYAAQYMASFCFHYAYEDLKRACALFEAVERDSPGLLETIHVDPPSIHDPNGTTPTGYKLIIDEDQEGALSYADLGVAFCELAERRDEFQGSSVGVSATGTVNFTPGVLMRYMAQGIKSRVWG